MLLRVVRTFLSLFLVLPAVAAFGFSPDLRLLQLVPPQSQIVAGMIGPSKPGQMGSFLLVTRNNDFDHEDFLALTGGDASRSIREVVFTAAAGRGGVLSEHSLIVGGHFDREAIFRLADTESARRENYRGVPVLAVPPLARERGRFTELRWLAIPEDGIAILGSVASVQRELDRWIAKSPVDAEFVERLRRIDQKDETWCLLPAPKRDGAVAHLLASLDARLGAVAGEAEPIEYGMHFGRHVEITASASAVAEEASGTMDLQLAQPMGVSYFLSASTGSESDTPKHVTVKVAQRRYEEWLAQYPGGLLIAQSHR